MLNKPTVLLRFVIIAFFSLLAKSPQELPVSIHRRIDSYF
jgi:hypothetical protein